MVQLLVRFGRTLGLKTLAEDVETTDQLDHLRGENIAQTQGSLLSRPLELKATEALIASHTSAMTRLGAVVRPGGSSDAAR